MVRSFTSAPLLLGVSVLLGGCGMAARGTARSPRSVSLDRWLDSVRVAHHLPGLAAVVARADGIVAIGVTGARRLATAPAASDRVQLDDRFELGSNTKALTAMLAARLVERHRIRWTSTVAEVFPEVGTTIDPSLRDVTLADLLAHRSGLAPFTDSDEDEWRRMPIWPEAPAAARAAFTRWLLTQTPSVPPRTRPQYSNAGYVVAAAMLERADGRAWEELLRDELLVPLGLARVMPGTARGHVDGPWGHASRALVDTTPSVALAHDATALLPVSPGDPRFAVPAWMAPAGGLSMSIAEYAAVLRVHLQGLRGREPGVLSSASVQRLHQPLVAGERFALGWGTQVTNGVTSSTHEGSAGSFHAVAVIQPERDVAVAVFVNAGGNDAAAAARQAARALTRLPIGVDRASGDSATRAVRAVPRGR